jgi:hypothetical protein
LKVKHLIVLAFIIVKLSLFPYFQEWVVNYIQKWPLRSLSPMFYPKELFSLAKAEAKC